MTPRQNRTYRFSPFTFNADHLASREDLERRGFSFDAIPIVRDGEPVVLWVPRLPKTEAPGC